MAGGGGGEVGIASRRRRDLVYGGHLALVAMLGLGRTLRSMQNAASASTRSFASSPPGRALAFLAMVGGMIALATVVGLTVVERRDRGALVLLALLAAAFWSRRQPDALDLVYAAGAVALSAVWFVRRRKGSASVA